jgi:hypothetical protein
MRERAHLCKRVPLDVVMPGNGAFPACAVMNSEV